MKVLTPEISPRYQLDGTTSYLLVSERTCGARRLSITRVDVAPGAHQPPHAHEPEQVYTILAGTGTMLVAGERRSVAAGDSIFIPAWAEHGIENSGATVLTYLSACSPAFTAQACRDIISDAFKEGRMMARPNATNQSASSHSLQVGVSGKASYERNCSVSEALLLSRPVSGARYGIRRFGTFWKGRLDGVIITSNFALVGTVWRTKQVVWTA
jgi:mannose-6-phosphate isomerase-like protein (cupin superfamily)